MVYLIFIMSIWRPCMSTCISRCWKSFPPMTRLFTLQNSTEFNKHLSLWFIVPHPCVPIAQSLQTYHPLAPQTHHSSLFGHLIIGRKYFRIALVLRLEIFLRIEGYDEGLSHVSFTQAFVSRRNFFKLQMDPDWVRLVRGSVFLRYC